MGNKQSRADSLSNGIDYVVVDGAASSSGDLTDPLDYGTVGKVNSDYGHAIGQYDDTDDDEESVEELPPQAKALVYRCAFVSSLTSVLLGFDVGIFSGAILYIGSDLGLSTVQQEIIVGSLNLIAAFGGLIAGKVSSW